MYPPRGLIGGSRPIGLAAPPPPLCYSTCGVVVVASGKPPSDRTLAPLRRGFFCNRALLKRARLISEPGHQGPTYSVASGLGAHLLGHPHTDVGGPGVFARPGAIPSRTARSRETKTLVSALWMRGE